MTHRLETKIAAVGGRVRRLWVLHGLGWLAAVLLGVGLLLVGFDYMVRFDDRGIRVMSSVAMLLLSGWAVYRFAWIPLRARLTLVDVAKRLEKRFPALADRLASSLQFLGQPEDDPREGSAELRRAVIHETVLASDAFDLSDAIDPRPTVRALAAGFTLLALAVILACLRPELATVGIRRLVHPLGDDAWPQQNHLGVRNLVNRVAAGQPFEVEVIDARGVPLPDELWVLFRQLQPDGGFSEERQALTAVRGTAIARREHVTKPFAYRVIGGDDQSMPWVAVQVVDPPVIGELKLRLHYPPYTAWPDQPTERHLRAVAGTHVEIAGAATKTLRGAKVVYEDGREVLLAVGPDQKTFALAADAAPPFVIDKSGAYWFELEDQEGLIGGREVRYEMRAVRDLEPNVSIDAPPANTFATPSAVIPLKVTAVDDLALQRVSLAYSRSDRSDQEDQSFDLYAGSSTASPPSHADGQSVPLLEHGERRPLEHRWDLASLGLAPGVQLTFHATATDYQPLVGRSTPRHITIIAPQELETRLEERQAQLLAELSRVLQLEQGSRAQLAATVIQAEQVGRLDHADLDRLQSAASTQRQVDRALTNREEGLRANLAGILADIENNQLDNPEIKRRTQAMVDELVRLERENLPRIDRALTAAEKGAKANRQANSSQADRATLSAVKEAAREQDQVIVTLERLLGDLSQWDSQRRIVRELTDLERQQRELSLRTTQVGTRTLSKEPGQLTPQEQADLKKLVSEQQELARRLDAAQQNMGRAGAGLEQDDPLAAQAIADALAKGQQRATPAKMREAGASIGRNQIGQASAHQNQAADDLQEMLDILSNRREHELARLVKKLREAEQELQALRKEQAGLQKKIDAANQLPDPAERQRQLERLAKSERELAQQAERMARRLDRLQAERSANSLAQAAGKMDQSGQQGEAGLGEQASDSAAQAERDLDDAQSQLAERRRQAEQDLAQEQMAKMQESLVSLRDRQAAAIGETERLETMRRTAGQLTRAQMRSVLTAAQNQEALAQEAQSMAKRLSAAAAFALAISGAGQEMNTAAALLKRQETGAATLNRQRHALTRLEQLLAALAPNAEDQAAKPAEDAGGAGGAPAGTDSRQNEQIPELAQLKLVKSMQQELNERTAALGELIAHNAQLDEEQQQEFAWLGEQQGKLADVITNLTEPEDAAAGPDADGLPELDLDTRPDEPPSILEGP